jgi:hypothetical protein
MNKVFYPYWEWEESQSRLWDFYCSEKDNLELILATMEDIGLFSSGMEKVITNWPVSCRQNLTDLSQNRVAWLGQASMAILLNVSSIATRKCWNILRVDLQIASNAVANYWIKEWEYNYGE